MFPKHQTCTVDLVVTHDIFLVQINLSFWPTLNQQSTKLILLLKTSAGLKSFKIAAIILICDWTSIIIITIVINMKFLITINNFTTITITINTIIIIASTCCWGDFSKRPLWSRFYSFLSGLCAPPATILRLFSISGKSEYSIVFWLSWLFRHQENISSIPRFPLCIRKIRKHYLR